MNWSSFSFLLLPCSATRNEEWYNLETGTQIWHPELYIGNDVETQNLLNFAQNTESITSLWFHYPDQELRYASIFTAKIACSLDFQMYPFDSHTCVMNINTAIP